MAVAARLTEDIDGCTVLAGKGYDSGAFRYDKRIHKKHGLIERVFGKLKENLRLSPRHEKSDLNFLGFIIIAFIRILLC
jgi:hypothetical protein